MLVFVLLPYSSRFYSVKFCQIEIWHSHQQFVIGHNIRHTLSHERMHDVFQNHPFSKTVVIVILLKISLHHYLLAVCLSFSLPLSERSVCSGQFLILSLSSIFLFNVVCLCSCVPVSSFSFQFLYSLWLYDFSFQMLYLHMG